MADEQQCVFCHIAGGKIPAKKVFEDDKVTAVLDINPASDGHILLIPKAHIAIMPQMDDDLSMHVGMVAKQISHALIKSLKCEGTSIFIANGAAAGQRAPHFMLHVIPRRQGDDVGLPLPIVKIPEQSMKSAFVKLSASIAKQFGKEPPKLESPSAPAKQEEKAQEKAQESQQNKQQEQSSKPSTKSTLDDIADFLMGGKK